MANAMTDQERAVGITAYVSSDTPGFHCTIKHRYTDFLVNEIVPGGVVQHLLNDKYMKGKQNGVRETDVADEGTAREEVGIGANVQAGKRRLEEDGKETTPPKKQKLEDATDADRKVGVFSRVSEADQNTLRGIFGEETTKSILNLYASAIMHPERKSRDHPRVQSEVISEKSKRTEAHVAIRKIFESKLNTEMLQEQPGVIAIRAALPKDSANPRGGANGNKDGAYPKGSRAWDELGGEYLHFSLYKENKDTMEVLSFLASRLKIPAKNFQFAGTKDRRAVTVQRVAIKRIHASQLEQLNKEARGWCLGDFDYRKDGLSLSDLDGNEFHLTLRDFHVEGEENQLPEAKLAMATKVVGEATASFAKAGFLNYYGLQRFGTYSTGSHDTGRKMLQDDLEGAINSILAYSDHLLSEHEKTSDMSRVPIDDMKRADAIKMWRDNDGDSADAIEMLPRRFQAESAIIQYLSKKKGGKMVQRSDWQGALQRIPRNLMLIYPHAYQSFVWNHAAGKRWELYGNRVVEGDLVIVGDKDQAKKARDEVDETGEPIFHPAENDIAPSTEDAFTRARYLSKEEAESGKYDVFDVVLPQPGFDVLYPRNEVGKFYKEFMASEAGGGLDPHSMRRSWKDISLPGGYRKVLAKPGPGLEFDMKSYVHPEEQLVKTDLEALRAKKGSNGANGKDDRMDTDDEKKVAVVLKMKLGVSQYATMALRELAKGGAVNYKPEFSANR